MNVNADSDDSGHLRSTRARRTAGETRSSLIAAELRHSIMHGDYHPGERLVELTLAHSFHVSQNTIRDALRILEQEGWVVKRARRGVYLRTYTLEDVDELFALLIAIETVTLERLMSNQKQRAQRLADPVAAARRALYSGDTQAVMESLFEIHELLTQLYHQHLTAQLVKTLYNQVRLLEAIHQARAPRSPVELEAQISLHHRLIRAVEAGDLPAAKSAVVTFLSEYSTRTIEVLRLLR